jgi:site-specific DNA-cytosine methylase
MGRLDDLAATISKYAPQPQIAAKNGIDVLSAFDGIGAARVALDEAGVPVRNYYSSEVDPYAAAIVRKNYPDVIELGDIKQIKTPPKGVDLMCGGSPCQDLSRAKLGGGEGLAGDKSSLFWDFVRVRDAAQPKHFLFENVVPRGSVDDKDVRTISNALGVDPVLLDASEFGAMRRPRLFWTDMDVPLHAQSTDQFRNHLLGEVDPKYIISERGVAHMHRPAGQSGRTPFQRHGMYESDPKARTITRSIYKGIPHNAVQLDGGQMRRLTPQEIESLFGFPANYTEGVSDARRYMGLGNSWSVPTAAHLLRGLLL